MLYTHCDCNSISIHAPARGATCFSAFGILHRVISIHAPARGATKATANYKNTSKFQSTLPRGERLAIAFSYSLAIEFQSTLPRGERPQNQREIVDGSYISIHAPARGATIFVGKERLQKRNFNPRSREGSDSNFYLKSYLILGKNCLKLLKSLNISILQNIFKHSMTYFQVRIPPSIYVSLAFAPNL